MKKYLEKCKQPKKMKKKKSKKKGKGDNWVGFKIHHFCDDVIYTCNLFLEKNMDAIHPDSAKMFKKSKAPMVQMIGAGTHHKKKKKKKKAKSVTGLFSQQLINLITTLNITEPYFCRAMKPNWNKSSKEWDDVLVTDQLRSGGLIEALRVLKLGYPTRVPYKSIWDKFHDKLKNPFVANLDMMGFAEAVLMAFGVDKSTYCLGLTKIFFKPAKAAILETIMKSADKPMSGDQIALIKKFNQEKRLSQMIGGCKIFLKLSLRIRFKRARENLAKWGRIVGGIARSVVRHADYAKNIILIKACQKIQAYYRSKVLAKEAKPMVEEKKKAAQKVFHMWRRYEERTKLLEWLTENCASAKARAEEMKNMSPEERAAREEKRKAERAAKAAAAAEAAANEAAAKDAALADEEAAAQAARESAMAAQNSNAVSMEDADKIARAAQAKRQEALRLAAEKAQRDKENSELWKLLHPESSGEEEDYEDETGEHHTRKVIDFKKEAAHGHMFTVYHPRKNRTPHERFVKMNFSDGNPKDISWGSGARFIAFEDIKLVVKGCKTKTMQVWKDQADETHCFSIIGKDKTLDLQASDDHSRDVWVKGICKMLGMSEEDRQAGEDAYDPDSGEVVSVEKAMEQTPSQKVTQRNLFNIQVQTVIREINFEGIYGVLNDMVKEEFATDVFYQKALKDCPDWKQWDTWVRSQIVAYLLANGLVDPSVAEAQEAKVAEEKAAAASKPKPTVMPMNDCMIA